MKANKANGFVSRIVNGRFKVYLALCIYVLCGPTDTYSVFTSLLIFVLLDGTF